MPKTFAEEMEDYDRERIAEINRRDTPEARARSAAKRQAEAFRIIKMRRRAVRRERFIELSAWGI